MPKIPKGFCQLNIYSVLFDSCLSPSLDYKFHGGRECVLSLFTFVILGLVCGGLSVCIC